MRRCIFFSFKFRKVSENFFILVVEGILWAVFGKKVFIGYYFFVERLGKWLVN